MSEKHSLGQKGEQIAAKYLAKKGYIIRNKNWRSGAKEIDIIAEYKGFLVIVEVKTRKHNYLESPFKAVNKAKQRNLIFAASNYINKFEIDLETRFDIVTVVQYPDGRIEIDHLEDAFYPTL